MSVSDNSAADLLLDRVGLDTRAAAGQGARPGWRPAIVGGPRQVLESMLADVGARDEREFAVRVPHSAGRRGDGWPSGPAAHNASTPREMTRLLRMSGAMRQGRRKPARWYGPDVRQVFRHRLAAGFGDGVRGRAKTGTLPGLHNRGGRGPISGRRAVRGRGVRPYTRASRRTAPTVDVAIGRAAARIAVGIPPLGGPAPVLTRPHTSTGMEGRVPGLGRAERGLIFCVV